MKSKRLEKKISLKKELIARLTGVDMNSIQGGIVETGCVTNCCTDVKCTLGCDPERTVNVC